MDRKVETSRNDKREFPARVEFDALFAQLDCPEASAPLEGGFHRLFGAIETLKRAQPAHR